MAGEKRKHCDSDVNKVIDIALHTPKRKKLVNTAKYVYQAFFCEGKHSDVTVCALGEEFNLHKAFLCQSPYFASMFGGSWLESTQKSITIEIVDPFITIDSLKAVLGSLYNYEINLSPLEIVSILGTAMMLQLAELIEKCVEVMVETINPKTSLDYYHAACQYVNKKLEEVCFKWFLVNLIPYNCPCPSSELATIPISLMSKLISHPDLFVTPSEYAIYSLLKYWIYLRLHPGSKKPSSYTIIDEYFYSRTDKLPYLLTSEGEQFISVFQGLRLQDLVSYQQFMLPILQDNIIPRAWLDPVIVKQWENVLRVNQNDDKGPGDVSDEVFLANSLRCGKFLSGKRSQVWGCTGFHFGVNLLMITDGLTLSIKRSHRSDLEQLLSLQTTRHVAIRVTVVKLNKQRQIVYEKQSKILKVSLAKGEEIQIMSFDKDLEYPIIISTNVMYTSPDNEENTVEKSAQSIS